MRFDCSFSSDFECFTHFVKTFRIKFRLDVSLCKWRDRKVSKMCIYSTPCAYINSWFFLYHDSAFAHNFTLSRTPGATLFLHFYMHIQTTTLEFCHENSWQDLQSVASCNEHAAEKFLVYFTCNVYILLERACITYWDVHGKIKTSCEHLTFYANAISTHMRQTKTYCFWKKKIEIFNYTNLYIIFNCV